MEDQLIATIAELGTQVGFMIYLVTQNRQQAAQLKEMQDKYEALLERAISAIGEIGHRL